MKQIYVKTTESCQLHCKHCYIGDARLKTRFFDEIKTAEWLHKCIEYNHLNEEDLLISFHGGEPMICKESKIKYICEQFPKATFNTTTNLVYKLTDEKLDLFLNHFIDKNIDKPFIKTSWDYKIRFNGNEEEVWKANIKELQEKGVFIQVIVCLTSLLINEVSPNDFLNIFKDLNINTISFERLTANTTSDEYLIPNYSKQDQWLYDLYKINEEKYHLSLCIVDDIIKAIKGQFLGCRERKCMENVLTINADGTISGCPNTALCKVFGTIYDEPKDVFKNPCRNCCIIKEQQRDPRCYICDLYNICNGDCHQLSWQENYCPAPKKLMKELLKTLDK